MFENIGKKIKGLARVLFFLEAIGSFIVGIVLLANGDESTVIVGLLVMIGGILFSWVSVCLLYGFGEIIDKLQDIERNTRGAVGNTSSEKATPIAGTNAAEEAQAVTATKTIDRCDF